MEPSTELPVADRVGAIAAVLQSDITAGRFPVGARLPSEADLCTRFQVSRPTLREALSRLAALGLIVSRRGSGGGSFVAQPDPGAIATRLAAVVALVAGQDSNPLALTVARLQVQVGCAELAALARAEITDIRAEIDLQSDFALPAPAFVASCRRMHLGLCAASDNPVLTMLGQALVEAEFDRPAPSGHDTRERARLLSCHVRIANGIAGGRPDDSRAALADLLAFETERFTQAGADQPPRERPPRMRDLRLPRVQRLGAPDDAPEG